MFSMSTHPIYSAITVSAEPVKKNNGLFSGELHVDHQEYTLVSDEDGTLHQRFRNLLYVTAPRSFPWIFSASLQRALIKVPDHAVLHDITVSGENDSKTRLQHSLHNSHTR